jgi:hypothetical protein
MTQVLAESSFRKYSHVKEFYEDITIETIKLGLKYNIPPAATLAIAGLESGFGSGYVSKITANILSLGARSDEIELPALTVAVTEDNRVLINKDKIYKEPYVYYQKRPPSLKKDYRPLHLAGSSDDLDYFEKNQNAKLKARLKNIEDFMSSWITTKTKVKAFRDAKVMMDILVDKHGKKILFDYDVNVKFISAIGGKPRSFNYRESWVKKAIKILDKTGINDVSSDIYYNNKTFHQAWRI